MLRLRNGPRRTGGRLSIRAVTGSEVAATVGPSANSRVVEARNLVREYGSAVAVAGVDLQLGRGEFLSIFGPNGAGKSSLLGMLSGALRPSSGTVHVMGRTVDDREATWRRHIGVLSHRGFLYGQLTAEENLRFYGTLYGLSDLDKRVAEQLRRVGLEGRAGSRVRALSHGMRQRLSLARALLHDPELVLLDEPFTGLDPSAAALLRGVLTELRDGHRTVVMVTHNLREGLAIATRIAVQVTGRFAWEGPRHEAGDDFEREYHRIVEDGSPSLKRQGSPGSAGEPT